MLLTPVLRVGMHVGAFQNGGSEAFLSQVPEPAAYALLLAGGLAVVFWFARRRQARTPA